MIMSFILGVLTGTIITIVLLVWFVYREAKKAQKVTEREVVEFKDWVEQISSEEGMVNDTHSMPSALDVNEEPMFGEDFYPYRETWEERQERKAFEASLDAELPKHHPKRCENRESDEG